MNNDRLVSGATVAALLGTAHWFFGNLYEAVVISPNWVVDSPEQVGRLNDFLAVTGPTLYFVPLSQLTVLAVLALWWAMRRDPQGVHHRRAGVWALALATVTAVIVITVLPGLFGSGFRADPAASTGLTWVWNALNVVRMVLTAGVAVHLFRGFRVVERRRTLSGADRPARGTVP